jgi:NAD(P)-dependent dehydrogenase (short-subunit alcohol dehydrogenase family)
MPRALLIGNSDGIGLATTRLLLEEGWQVTGLSRSASPCSGAGYHHVVLDVCAPELRETLQALLATRGPFDACIYCAGIGVELTPDDLRPDARVFEVNLMAAVATATVVIPAMVTARAGHFVVLSSLADELVSAAAPSYCASKAALSSYFEGLALALRPHGVAVTNVRFGFVDTKMARAPVRPFMITPARAAAVVRRALRRRRVRVSYPWRTAVLVRLLRWVTTWRLRLGRSG